LLNNLRETTFGWLIGSDDRGWRNGRGGGWCLLFKRAGASSKSTDHSKRLDAQSWLVAANTLRRSVFFFVSLSYENILSGLIVVKIL
jgi:hypothetical protein